MRTSCIYRSLVTASLALGLVLAAAPSQAQDDSVYARPGFYVLPRVEDETGLSASVDESAIVAGRFGYRMHPHFAIELQTEYMPEYDLELRSGISERATCSRRKISRSSTR